MAKINLMGEFNILLWQSTADYKSLEFNMGKTVILSIV